MWSIMPELPELAVIINFLMEKIVGKKITNIRIFNSICIRTGKDEFIRDLKNKQIKKIERIGKNLLFILNQAFISFNLMLTGRLQYLETSQKMENKIHFVFQFDDGSEIRYYDRKKMGKIHHFKVIPQDFYPNSPDIMEIDKKTFITRFKKFSRSPIKDILINQQFVLGIGNAYSDEILFASGIHPLKKGQELSDDQISLIFLNCQKILQNSINIINSNFTGKIEEYNREFMAIHGKKGAPCPKCGKELSSITANRRILNYCRNCQK
ncbi:MAG: hypothetical protein EAX96_11615 [Candidatus Lokiarchaeota archaeon]|nr:hypothetical protein [Candidatus Lokiarchaeota archaeon]